MGIRNKIKKQTFKDNEEYFKFLDKMKDIINITSFKILKNGIKIEYENKEVE